MATLSLVVFLAALIATSSGQSSGTNASTVWGSVIVVNNGERTPLSDLSSSALTPRGALQMRQQGSVFRSRYLGGPGDDGRPPNITDRLPIRGIEQDAIDNDQLMLYSLTDDSVFAGALAFMQGLYPPNQDVFPSSQGGDEMSMNIPAGSNDTYPANGYQYPVINTLSIYDERSVFLQGHMGCWNWLYTVPNVQADPRMQSSYSSNQESYDLFFNRAPLTGTFPDEKINFWYANELYEYAQYEYTHNETVHDGMEEWTTPSTAFETLKGNARRWEQALHANAAVSGLDVDDPIRTVAGRTLAQGILNQIQGIINRQGEATKLSVLFTSHPSFLAFFALAGLRAADTDINDDFYGLPDPAAAMAFELIGNQPGEPDRFPDLEHLWIRFMWRRNSDPSSPLRGNELFRGAKSEYVVPWSAFRNRMDGISMDVSTWCDSCKSETMTFCRARALAGDNDSPASNDGSGNHGGVHNPVVAGVIGAIVALGVAALVAVAAAVFGGVRMYRRGKGDEHEGTTRGLGGFKGAEKMASDADLTTGRGGIRHERVGSWELQGGGPGPAGSGSAPDSGDPEHLGAGLTFAKSNPLPHSRQVVDDDGVSALSADIGSAPVRPRESI